MTIYADMSVSGSGAPVLLIHGSMNSKSQWQALTAELDTCFTVFAVDLFGYGKTPFPPKPETHSLADEVELVRRTISQRCGTIPALHVVAHSYGGMVALSYACSYPDEVASLTLFEPMANRLLLDDELTEIYAEGRLLVDTITRLVVDGRTDEGAKHFVDYFAGDGIYSMLPSNARRTLSGYVRKMLIDYRTTIETPLDLIAYQGIGCPLALISGTSSAPISRSISLKLKNELSGIEWFEVDGNHMAPISNPGPVNAIIAARLTNLMAGR